nr:transposase [Sphingomonas oleivorans]
MLPIEPENRGRGKRPEQNRSIINGILWRLRCGAPWRDVPSKYGSWNTLYRRFRRWSEAGVWETVAVTLAEIMADSGHYSIDSTTVRLSACLPTMLRIVVTFWQAPPMSRQRAEKGDSSTRSWPLAGRVHQ